MHGGVFIVEKITSKYIIINMSTYIIFAQLHTVELYYKNIVEYIVIIITHFRSPIFAFLDKV